MVGVLRPDARPNRIRLPPKRIESVLVHFRLTETDSCICAYALELHLSCPSMLIPHTNSRHAIQYPEPHTSVTRPTPSRPPPHPPATQALVVRPKGKWVWCWAWSAIDGQTQVVFVYPSGAPSLLPCAYVSSSPTSSIAISLCWPCAMPLPYRPRLDGPPCTTAWFALSTPPPHQLAPSRTYPRLFHLYHAESLRTPPPPLGGFPPLPVFMISLLHLHLHP
ncbi:hypothetical protein LshimejAT787_1800120 [Lyophyllum shimeji]|uniref:Uncharacterized protein n=1 Tax=Lyophyllum shimeji TaxID=47721 RepID=A0A9P3PZ56_LYOSH|nr:hypothetical protein LshimejAT787_1800120 [Lyophyllum shimeji]